MIKAVRLLCILLWIGNVGYFTTSFVLISPTTQLYRFSSPVKNNIYPCYESSLISYPLEKKIGSSFDLLQNAVRNNRSSLNYRREDSLVGGLSEISIAGALGVMWSEYSVMRTGCGPMDLSDNLERLCYEIVIVASGVMLFTRILTRKSLVQNSEDVFGNLEYYTLFQVKLSEYFTFVAIVGAFVALYIQSINGVQAEGLTGIDVDMCRAIQSLK